MWPKHTSGKSASPAVLKGSGTHRLLPDTAWRERLRDTSGHGRRSVRTPLTVVTRGNALLDHNAAFR
ncbi:hypothetical protein ACOMHN_015482 [Nucella lapillus]